MNQTATVVKEKFHSIFGADLRVALEATFDPHVNIEPVGEVYPNLLHVSPFVKRVYYPAISDGDMLCSLSGQVVFIPWVNEEEVQYHRLVLWAQSIDGKNFWMRFGRFGELESFTFNDVNKPYIHLDFFSLRRDEFIPLYMRARNRFFSENGLPEIINFVLEAEITEDSVALNLRRVDEAALPSHLAAEKP